MKSKKFYIEQLDSNDCGAACLAMLCKYYGKEFTITKLRDLLGTDLHGTPINGLHVGAEQLGFDVAKIRITKDVIHENFTLPAVCHIRTIEGAGHYVVLHKVKNETVTILDPAKGIIKLTADEFFEMFDGLILLMYPTGSFEKATNSTGSVLKIFFAFMKSQKKLFIFAVISSVIITLLGIFSSLFNKVLMDEVLPYQLEDLLVAYTIGFSAVLLVKVLLEAVRQHLVLYLSQRIDLPLMLGYFKHVFNLPIGFFASRKIGDVTTRFQDAFVIKNIMTNAMLTIIIDVMLAITTLIIMINMSIHLTIIILVITILSVILVYVYKPIYKKLNKKQMEQSSRLNSSIIESLKGVETIKANAYEKPTMDKVETEYVRNLKISFNQGVHSNIQGSISQTIHGLGNLLLMAFGVHLVIQGQITMGTILAFLTIAGFFMGPINRLISLQLQIQEASISLKRLAEIQDIDEEEAEERDYQYISSIEGDIVIKDLTFRYGSRSPVLKNVNLTIPQGKKIAIVGESGSGKTTLSKLLMKFYKASDGEILINKIDIKNINAFSLRSSMGYVPQSIETFSGSIIDNIRVGKEDATIEEIRYACENTGCSSFISRMPFGYNTFLDENGGGLSGGEKQRLALARAFVKKPKFVILDEATSNLDLNTELEISGFLFKKQTNTSMLIIAHRLSTIRNCDAIYVLDKGEVAELGTHDELLEKGGLYYKLWINQVGKISDVENIQNKSLDIIKTKISEEDEIEYK